MLLDGVNHVAWLTNDSTRLGDFYRDVFEAGVLPTRDHGPGGRRATPERPARPAQPGDPAPRTRSPSTVLSASLM